MGSNYRDGSISVKGNESKDDVIKRIDDHIKSDLEQYGNDPYSGSFGAKVDDGIDFHNEVVSSQDEAYSIIEPGSKYSPIVVVRVKSEKSDYWYYGGWCRC